MAKFIVMDMSSQFKRVVKALFPHAHIVCDCYHICRLVDGAIERVRKREQKRLTNYSKTLKQNRRILMKNPGKLTKDEMMKLTTIFHISEDLRLAYYLKLTFRRVFKTYGQDRIQAHIQQWIQDTITSELKEFSSCKTSFTSWILEITNAFLLPYSNGYTEGVHNKIKVLKRISFGFRNCKRFRVRILIICKKRRIDHNCDQSSKTLVGVSPQHLT